MQTTEVKTLGQSSNLFTAFHRDMLIDVATRIRAVEPTSDVVLFGSRARGDAREDSDWDLLILTEGPPTAERRLAVRRVLRSYSLDEETELRLVFLARSRYEDGEGLNSFLYNVDQDAIWL